MTVKTMPYILEIDYEHVDDKEARDILAGFIKAVFSGYNNREHESGLRIKEIRLTRPTDEQRVQ